MPIHEVERSLHEKLLGLGNLLLRSFVEKEGTDMLARSSPWRMDRRWHVSKTTAKRISGLF